MLRGWPWHAAAVSWVEPTATALLALRVLSTRVPVAGTDERIEEGERLLWDRACVERRLELRQPQRARRGAPSLPGHDRASRCSRCSAPRGRTVARTELRHAGAAARRACLEPRARARGARLRAARARCSSASARGSRRTSSRSARRARRAAWRSRCSRSAAAPSCSRCQRDGSARFREGLAGRGRARGLRAAPRSSERRTAAPRARAWPCCRVILRRRPRRPAAARARALRTRTCAGGAWC